MAHPRHKQLLKDPDVERWFNNLARGSVITAEERLRRLGRFCNATGYTPQTVVDFKRRDPEGFDKFMMDFVDASLKREEKPAQVKNNLVTVRSRLGHFGLKIDAFYLVLSLVLFVMGAGAFSLDALLGF